MEVPPTRYRVEERGRRLEVIDTYTGRVATRPPPGAPPDAGERPRRQGPGARAPRGDAESFRTRAFYDEKGPREIRLNYAGRARIRQLRFAITLGAAIASVAFFLLWPVSLVFPFALAGLAKQEQRASVRAAITRWLDEIDQSAAAPSSSG